MTDDFVTEAQAKLWESNWLKPMTFFQSAYPQIESVNKNVFCYFFPPPRVLCIMQRKPGLIFSQTLFLSVSLALFIPILIPPYITATRNGSPVCGLCPSKLCLVVYLLLRINHWQKGKQMEWVCTFLPGVSPSYRQPNHKTDLTIL